MCKGVKKITTHTTFVLKSSHLTIHDGVDGNCFPVDLCYNTGKSGDKAEREMVGPHETPYLTVYVPGAEQKPVQCRNDRTLVFPYSCIVVYWMVRIKHSTIWHSETHMSAKLLISTEQ